MKFTEDYITLEGGRQTSSAMIPMVCTPEDDDVSKVIPWTEKGMVLNTLLHNKNDIRYITND